MPPALHALLHGDIRQTVRSPLRRGRQFRQGAEAGGLVRQREKERLNTVVPARDMADTALLQK